MNAAALLLLLGEEYETEPAECCRAEEEAEEEDKDEAVLEGTLLPLRRRWRRRFSSVQVALSGSGKETSGPRR